MSETPTIVYITSRGHSGSTLLDVLIGSHSQAVGLGEVEVLSSRDRRWSRADRLDVRACVCGASPTAACPFWQGVEAALRAEAGIGLRELELDSGDREIFRAHNRAFYEAVRRTSGRRLLVDSSKGLDRLAALLAAGVFDVRCIHLVRDPRGVAHSHRRRGRSWIEASRRWISAEMRTRRLLAERSHLRVRYEDLTQEPEPTLTRIMGWLGLPFESAQLDWTRHAHHNIAGNPMLRSREPAIRFDRSWERGLSPFQKAVITWMALPARFPGTFLYDLAPPLWRLPQPRLWRSQEQTFSPGRGTEGRRAELPPTPAPDGRTPRRSGPRE